jgi:hypothetical protein
VLELRFDQWGFLGPMHVLKLCLFIVKMTYLGRLDEVDHGSRLGSSTITKEEE